MELFSFEFCPLCSSLCQIERFINSPEVRQNPPDYQDILQQVLRANDRHNLCLTRKHINQIAQEAFRETGSRIQDRRHLDLVYNFGSSLTDTYKPGKIIKRNAAARAGLHCLTAH